MNQSLKETAELEKKCGFKYHSIIGIMLFAYATCRVDVRYTISTLSKCTNYPNEHHFCSTQKLMVCLMQTEMKGLTFKHPKEKCLDDLPRGNNIF